MVGAAGAIAGRAAKRAQARAQAEANKKYITQQRDDALDSMSKQLNSDVQQANTQASQLQDQIVSGAESTYLGQVAAESKILDTEQQGAQAQGSLTARAAASGIKSGGTLADVLDEQVNASVKAQRTEERAGVTQNMSQIANIAENRQNLLSQFQTGSAYMDLYNSKKSSINKEAQLAIDQQNTTIANNQYGVTSFLQDLGSVAGAASSVYTAGLGAGWWGAGSYVAGGALNNYSNNNYTNQYAAGWRSK